MVKISLDEFAYLSAKILERGNDLRFVAYGSSMSPLIQDGDVLTIQPVEFPLLKVGKVAFYRTLDGGLIAHRIIDRYTVGDQLILRTRGDASPGSEHSILAEQVLGLVRIIQRGERIVHINEGIWKLLGLLWTHLYPLPFLSYRVTRKIGSSFKRSDLD
jgi:signal peptidase I